jgi:Cys-tRNA synthase (O-phospho-L-seryl-tRNA:Cys-tRNA synthase)
LVVHRTLDGLAIDTIIASAPERARRIEWNGVLENAARFTAGLEG